MMRRKQFAHLSSELHVRGDQYDEKIADSFEVSHEMGGEHDGDAVFGDDFHETLQKLTTGERVQGGHRLIEEEKLGTFGDCQSEGDLGALDLRTATLSFGVDRVRAARCDASRDHHPRSD